jgi:hypothetical protein
LFELFVGVNLPLVSMSLAANFPKRLQIFHTGCKFATGINYTSDTTPSIPVAIFAAGVVDTNGIDTSGLL